MTYRVGIIGTGPKERTAERGGGFAIGRKHADAWQQVINAKLEFACDINPDNLSAFAEDYSISGAYSDYKRMLQEEKPDIVDICTWPPLHREMVIAAAEAGVKGIYCEKPMCLSLKDVKDMMDSCSRNGVKLVIGHQRRFEPRFRLAKEWIQAGKIGAVQELHGSIHVADADLLSWGTHWIDMFNFLTDDVEVESVMAQADCTNGLIRYGHRVEEASIVDIHYSNGATAYLRGYTDASKPTGIRIIGDNGMIELYRGIRGMFADQPGWQSPRLKQTNPFADAMQELVDSILEDREPKEVTARLACRTTEIIMAAYESALQRAKVKFPLQQQEFPLSYREEYKQKG